MEEQEEENTHEIAYLSTEQMILASTVWWFEESRKWTASVKLSADIK